MNGDKVKNMEKLKNNLRLFFRITVAAFDFSKAIGAPHSDNEKSKQMHNLHILASEEVEKENPDFGEIELLLFQMQTLAEIIMQEIR